MKLVFEENFELLGTPIIASICGRIRVITRSNAGQIRRVTYELIGSGVRLKKKNRTIE